jgi:hypothetical protein
MNRQSPQLMRNACIVSAKDLIREEGSQRLVPDNDAGWCYGFVHHKRQAQSNSQSQKIQEGESIDAFVRAATAYKYNERPPQNLWTLMSTLQPDSNALLPPFNNSDWPRPSDQALYERRLADTERNI